MSCFDVRLGLEIVELFDEARFPPAKPTRHVSRLEYVDPPPVARRFDHVELARPSAWRRP